MTEFPKIADIILTLSDLVDHWKKLLTFVSGQVVIFNPDSEYP